MNPARAAALRELLQGQQIAALGTLHAGRPFVSMVPFALLPGSAEFVIHVSQLAAHTQDMLANPEVSLLVVAPPRPEVPAQATARVTLQGRATPCTQANPLHAQAQAAYLARFPHSAQMFGFADFSLFIVPPTSVRYVGGFAQAMSLGAEEFAAVLGAAAQR